MSLPQFDVQGSLFESLGAIAPELFSENDKYKRFAQKVWPVLAQSREPLMECYQADNGRPGVAAQRPRSNLIAFSWKASW